MISQYLDENHHRKSTDFINSITVIRSLLASPQRYHLNPYALVHHSAGASRDGHVSHPEHRADTGMTLHTQPQERSCLGYTQLRVCTSLRVTRFTKSARRGAEHIYIIQRGRDRRTDRRERSREARRTHKRPQHRPGRPRSTTTQKGVISETLR